jgi:chromosome segregation ATPase
MDIPQARKKLKSLTEVLPLVKDIEAILEVVEHAEYKQKKLIESVASLKTQVSDKSNELNELSNKIEANRLNAKANREEDKEKTINMVEDRLRQKKSFIAEMDALTKSLQTKHDSLEESLRAEIVEITQTRDTEQNRLNLIKTQLRELKSALV